MKLCMLGETALTIFIFFERFKLYEFYRIYPTVLRCNVDQTIIFTLPFPYLSKKNQLLKTQGLTLATSFNSLLESVCGKAMTSNQDQHDVFYSSALPAIAVSKVNY